MQALSLIKVSEYIASGKFQLKTSHRQEKGASPVWSTFLDVIDESDVVTSFVSCSMCKKLYKYVPKNGTSGLLNHQKKCLDMSLTRISEALENQGI